MLLWMHEHERCYVHYRKLRLYLVIVVLNQYIRFLLDKKDRSFNQDLETNQTTKNFDADTSNTTAAFEDCFSKQSLFEAITSIFSHLFANETQGGNSANLQNRSDKKETVLFEVTCVDGRLGSMIEPFLFLQLFSLMNK